MTFASPSPGAVVPFSSRRSRGSRSRWITSLLVSERDRRAARPRRSRKRGQAEPRPVATQLRRPGPSMGSPGSMRPALRCPSGSAYPRHERNLSPHVEPWSPPPERSLHNARSPYLEKLRISPRFSWDKCFPAPRYHRPTTPRATALLDIPSSFLSRPTTESRSPAAHVTGNRRVSPPSSPRDAPALPGPWATPSPWNSQTGKPHTMSFPPYRPSTASSALAASEAPRPLSLDPKQVRDEKLRMAIFRPDLSVDLSIRARLRP